MDHPDLLDRFYSQAREIYLEGKGRISLSDADLEELVSNELFVARFRMRFRQEIQNKELQALIFIYLEGLAGQNEELAEEALTDADGLDRYVGRVGIGIAAAGVAGIIASGGIAALTLALSGIAGMAVSWLTTTVLRRRSRPDRHSV